ncbi:MAG: acetyl-CoA C-acyltransferase [Sulfobacillus acidophilus]|uniref:Acetyl-CoA acetyltransferase n=1 Tax=Sulfobacillus acidophilus TaxID=53633 RepID=A0A2T2WJS4_9FIRM|nr:MAG: acetyl-CoA C-acyltransferase [Sulfobacillus acidophilus]
MEDVVILDGVRAAIGTFGGSLKDTPASELGGIVVKEALTRSSVDPAAVDEVIMGCVGQVSGDAFLARRIALAAGLPAQGTTAQTVNRLCGSGLQAIITGTQWLKLGDADAIVAGGAENMSRLPYYVWNRWGRRLGHGELEDGVLSAVTDPFGQYPMGETAEILAERYHVSRQEQDQLAWDSQVRAHAAIAEGRFAAEIVPVMVKDARRQQVAFKTDEHPRDTSLEQLQKLKPAFRPNGTVTAGNASGINDGAAAVVLMRATDAERKNLSPRARVVSYAVAGVEPEVMGYAPVYAIAQALKRANLAVEDLDLIELNEAFAAQAVAVVRDAHLPWEKTNVNGGAIALGHPIGATGAILTVKLLYELERRRGRYGLVTMCIGGGQGIAAIFENYRR